MPRARRLTQRQAGVQNGWRSGLEEALGAQLRALGVSFGFEAFSVPFTQPQKPRKYTPDFSLPNGIVIESKGRFLTADRAKHLMVQAEHPDIDIRFVFSNPNTRISKQSKTTYAMWCQSKGFLYAKGLIPEAWLKEPANARSLAAIERLTK
jgi:hypothetical protein